MNAGSEILLKQHGSRINVAIAWIKGEIGAFENCVPYLVDRTTVAAAHARLDLIAKGVIDDDKSTTQ